MVQAALYITYLIYAFTVQKGVESFFLQINRYTLPCYIIYILNVRWSIPPVHFSADCRCWSIR